MALNLYWVSRLWGWLSGKKILAKWLTSGLELASIEIWLRVEPDRKIKTLPLTVENQHKDNIMSLNSKKSPLAVRVRNISLKESLFEEGVELISGRLESTLKVDHRQLTLDEMEYIESLDYSWEKQEATEAKFCQLIKDKSPGAKFLAWECRNAAANGQGFDLAAARKDWAATKELREWGSKRGAELTLCDLASPVHIQEDGYESRKIYTGKLLHLGIRYAWQAERFLNLYKEVQVTKRPWGSCYQPSHQKVLEIATTPNYNRLPIWVKRVLVNAPAFEVSERVGDIWRLIDCARAWKWCGDLPKGIAEKIGKMSVKSRLLAGLAWNKTIKGNSTGWATHNKNGWENYDGETISRSKLTTQFWLNFREFSRMSFAEILPRLIREEEYSTSCRYMKRFAVAKLEIVLGLPHQTITSESVLDSKDEQELIRGLVDYLSPEKACAHLFGASGKATVKAFQSSQPVVRQWASVLAYGNPDLLQKYFKADDYNCIAFEKDAVPFLMHLSPEVALRMVQTTHFKVRGEVHAVDPNLVRDTGYLFTRLQENVPNLGRVRCWLSVHEALAKEYVNRLPDFQLKVNPDFQRVQGLCAVDGSWEIEIPTRNAQLKLWGEQLSHCVGGYGEAVNSGRSIILAIREYGQVTHTVEMVPNRHGYRCQQFYGYRNSSAPDKLSISVLGALSQAGLSN